jgi:hypothetical protein
MMIHDRRCYNFIRWMLSNSKFSSASEMELYRHENSAIMQNRYQSGMLETNMYKDTAIENHDMLLVKAPMNVLKRVAIIITC